MGRYVIRKCIAIDKCLGQLYAMNATAKQLQVVLMQKGLYMQKLLFGNSC